MSTQQQRNLTADDRSGDITGEDAMVASRDGQPQQVQGSDGTARGGAFGGAGLSGQPAGGRSGDDGAGSASVAHVARAVVWLLGSVVGFVTVVWLLQFVPVWTARFGWLPVMVPVFVAVMVVSAVMMSNAMTLLRLSKGKDQTSSPV